MVTIEESEKLTPAAVLVPFFEKQGELYILLTQRSDVVRHHKGQISFPGGSVEEQDDSLWQTAVRETHEELGIPESHIQYVSRLPLLHTPTYYAVTPFIAFLKELPEIKPNQEVDHVFSVPVNHLKDLEHLRFEEREYFGETYPVPFFSYGEYEIWGITGRILLSWLNQWGEKLDDFYQTLKS